MHIERAVRHYVRHQLLGLPRKTYWQKRQKALYLQEVRRLVGEVSLGARSILDVGSHGCGYLDWFPQIPQRVSLDICEPYSAPGVESIKADFLAHDFDQRFDVVLCLQVMEHIPEAAGFAQRLLAAGRRVIVSVPYKWPVGRCGGHVQDPVDEAKLASWFQRAPTHSAVIRERRGAERIVCCY